MRACTLHHFIELQYSQYLQWHLAHSRGSTNFCQFKQRWTFRTVLTGWGVCHTSQCRKVTPRLFFSSLPHLFLGLCLIEAITLSVCYSTWETVDHRKYPGKSPARFPPHRGTVRAGNTADTNLTTCTSSCFNSHPTNMYWARKCLQSTIPGIVKTKRKKKWLWIPIPRHLKSNTETKH